MFQLQGKIVQKERSSPYALQDRRYNSLDIRSSLGLEGGFESSIDNDDIESKSEGILCTSASTVSATDSKSRSSTDIGAELVARREKRRSARCCKDIIFRAASSQLSLRDSK